VPLTLLLFFSFFTAFFFCFFLFFFDLRGVLRHAILQCHHVRHSPDMVFPSVVKYSAFASLASAYCQDGVHCHPFLVFPPQTVVLCFPRGLFSPSSPLRKTPLCSSAFILLVENRPIPTFFFHCNPIIGASAFDCDFTSSRPIFSEVLGLRFFFFSAPPFITCYGLPVHRLHQVILEDGFFSVFIRMENYRPPLPYFIPCSLCHVVSSLLFPPNPVVLGVSWPFSCDWIMRSPPPPPRNIRRFFFPAFCPFPSTLLSPMLFFPHTGFFATGHSTNHTP